MFHNAYVHGFFFVIANLDFEGFVDPVVGGIDANVGAFAFAAKIERVTGEDTNSFIFRRVINTIFADKFQMAIGIAPVKAQAAFG